MKWLAAHEPGIATRRAARIAAVLLLGAAILLGLVSGGHIEDLRSKGLAAAERFGYSADDINVAGLTHHQPSDVLRAIGVEAGQSLVMFSAAEALQVIEKLSWVQSATVERRLPNQLLITVSERVPFAIWQKGTDYTVIDRGGFAMDGLAISDLQGLPMVTGEGANLAAPQLIDAMQNVPDIMLRMHAAARIGSRRWNIYLDDGLKIMLPEGDVEASLRELGRIDQSIGLLSKGIVAVDLRDRGKLVVTRAPMPEPTDSGLLTGSTTRAKQ